MSVFIFVVKRDWQKKGDGVGNDESIFNAFAFYCWIALYYLHISFYYYHQQRQELPLAPC